MRRLVDSKLILLGVGGALLVLAVCATPSAAQIAGTTQTVNHNLLFQTSQTNVTLDPLPNVGQKLKFTEPLSSGTVQKPGLGNNVIADILSSVGVSVPGWVFSLVNGTGSFSFVSVNPTFNLGLTGDVGGYFEVNSIGKAGIDVSYPMQVPVVFPQPNTFKCGDYVDIATSANLGGGSMSVDPAFYNLEIGPVVENVQLVAQVGLSASVCFGLPVAGKCVGGRASFNSGTVNIPPAPLNINEPSLPALLNFCEAAFAPGADEAALLACARPGFLTPFLNLAQAKLDSYNASHGTSFGIADFSQGKVDVAPPDLPPDGPTLPEFAGSFLDVVSGAPFLNFMELDGGRRLQVAGTKTDLSVMEYDLVSLLEFLGKTTGASTGGGLLSIDLGDISPTLRIDQEMTYQFTADPHFVAMLGTPMDWQVLNSSGTVLRSGSGAQIPMVPGERLRVKYPQPLQDPTDVANSYSFGGQFSTHTQQRYKRSLTVRALQIESTAIGNHTALEFERPNGEIGGSPVVLEDHQFTLGGFNGQTPASFMLDPEKPILDITGLAVTDVINLGGGERAVVYRLNLGNLGDVRLSDVSALRDFANTFATATSFETLCTTSPSLNVNASFDGVGDTELLAAGNTLQVSQGAAIDMLVRVKPEISPIGADGCFGSVDYSASSSSSAYSPIGTFVQDRYDHCTNTFRSNAIVAEVDLGAAVLNGLEDFTIYGFDRVDLARGMALSYGHLGSGGQLMMVPLEGATSEDARIIGDVHVAGDFHLNQSQLEIDYLQLGGRLFEGGPDAELRVTGAASLGSTCVVEPTKPQLTAPVIAEGAPSLEVSDGETMALSPGAYREVALSRDSTMQIASGVYDLGRLEFDGDDAVVRFDVVNGPVTLNLVDWATTPYQRLAFVVENGPTSAVHIVYHGRRKQIFRDSLIQGTVVAPGAMIELTEGTELQGALYAERVIVGPGAGFEGHEFLAPVDIAPGCEGSL